MLVYILRCWKGSKKHSGKVFIRSPLWNQYIMICTWKFKGLYYTLGGPQPKRVQLTHLWAVCDMTHSYVWHDSFVWATCLTRTWAMTHSYVWHDSFICVTWLIHMCDMTHLYERHVSLDRVPWLIHDAVEEPQIEEIYERYVRDMCSFKSQVSFAK